MGNGGCLKGIGAAAFPSRTVNELPHASTLSRLRIFKLGDSTEVHVYGPLDEDHHFFGDGPVVALEVTDFAVARARLVYAGVKFIYEEPQRASGKIWQHFFAPDGNVYEIIGDDVAA